MDAKTLEALRKSIKKHENIITGEGTDEGQDNCALCQIFIENNCTGCPVKEKTKSSGCNNSPYKKWINHHKDMQRYGTHHYPYKIECPECERLAKEELEFLRSLLPEPEFPKEKFKVGDRVRCIKAHDLNKTIIGKIGVIREAGSVVAVEFYEHVKGHDGCGEDGHCWNFSSPHKYLLKEAPMCDCKEKCENFKSKEKFKWEGEVEWKETLNEHGNLIIYPFYRSNFFNKKKISGKRTRITIEEI